MSLGDTLARIEEEQRWEQFEETWGHLYPTPGDHPGTMVVAHSDYGDQGVCVVHEEFENVADSPWFYEWTTGFACDSMFGVDRWVWKKHVREDGSVHKYRSKERVGARKTGIWEFRGVLRVRPSGRAHFVGKWTKMSLYPGRLPAIKPRGPLLELYSCFTGKRKYMKGYVEGDRDWCESDGDALVRFMETVVARKVRRSGK